MAKLSESLRAMASIEREHYERDQKWQAKTVAAAADRYILQTPNQLSVEINDVGYAILTQANLDLSLTATWDQVVTDYRVAATRAGKDFYVYACQPSPANKDNPVFLISANAAFPDGYTADNSRNVGGFHCLCVAAGAIAGNTLTNYATGDILPQSVWDIPHRPVSSPAGMVYASALDKWVDIYIASGTGASTTSVNGGTISDNRNQMDFVDDGGAVKKRLLNDDEFQLIAAGSNEESNIWTRDDPVTTGGHYAYFLLTLDVGPAADWVAADTITGGTSGYTCTVVTKLTNLTYVCKNISNATGFTLGEILSNGVDAADQGAAHPTWAAHSGRIISNIGCEDCCGTSWQWLRDQSFRVEGSHTHTENTAASYTQNAETAAKDIAVWAMYDLPGAKGSLYRQGTYGDVKLLAGGAWVDGTFSGSRSCYAYSSRWSTHVQFGGRFLAEPL